MRRTRIKGVANIPQRKKNDTTQKTEEEPNNTNSDISKNSDPVLIEANRETIEREIIKKSRKCSEISKPCVSTKKSISVLDNSLIKEADVIKQTPNNLIKESKNIEKTESLPHSVDTKDNDLEEKIPLVRPCQSPSPNHIQETRKLKSPLTLEFRKVASPHNIGSDFDCALPPASPNKINRSRIKAVPRLAHRKISFSASESEDESKKNYQRVRNDSQSSSVSVVNEPTTTTTIENTMTNTTNKDVSSVVIHRKFKRTEWSKKVAEARKEFASKFISGKPDRKRLTMMDLIFYNPTTNIMKKEKTIVEEENVDDPSILIEDDPKKNEESELSGDENEMPAPQIKIGPSGEIILDEKSLVIENKNTKKEREKIENSAVIDDSSDRPYGVFKKVKRSKDWSDSETLKFYKALSTIGTDFSLMCDLFPNRNRRELKMKFKKEERVNHVLIDKALMQPCSFDFEELKKEFALDEAEKKKIEELMNKETKKSKKNTKSVKFSNIINEEERENEETTKKEKPKRKKTERIKPLKKRKFDISSVLNNDKSSDDDSDESVETLWQPSQTRFGRKVKQNQFYQSENNDLNVPKKNIRTEPEVAEELNNKKPGSIMMVSSKDEEGQPFLQIYMVTDVKEKEDKEKSEQGKNLVPIAMIKTGHTDDENEEETVVENNYTIPAVENVENK